MPLIVLGTAPPVYCKKNSTAEEKNKFDWQSNAPNITAQ